jgi:membrane protein
MAKTDRDAAAWRKPANRLRELTGRTQHWLPMRWLRRYFEIRGTDRALVLASQCFTALFPLIIVVATLLSSSDGEVLAERINERFHLTGTAADAVRTLFERPPGAQSAIGVGSVVLLVVSGLSLARSLQRTYEAAWRLPPLGLRGTVNGLAGLAILLSQILLLSLVAGLLRDRTGSVVLSVLRAALAVGLWLLLQSVLLGRRVPLRRLLPGALVAGVGQQVITAGSALWMPVLITTNTSRYGIIGVAFALLSWLLVIAVMLVGAAVVSAELGEGDVVAPRELTPRG